MGTSIAQTLARCRCDGAEQECLERTERKEKQLMQLPAAPLSDCFQSLGGRKGPRWQQDWDFQTD